MSLRQALFGGQGCVLDGPAGAVRDPVDCRIGQADRLPKLEVPSLAAWITRRQARSASVSASSVVCGRSRNFFRVSSAILASAFNWASTVTPVPDFRDGIGAGLFQIRDRLFGIALYRGDGIACRGAQMLGGGPGYFQKHGLDQVLRLAQRFIYAPGGSQFASDSRRVALISASISIFADATWLSAAILAPATALISETAAIADSTSPQNFARAASAAAPLSLSMRA